MNPRTFLPVVPEAALRRHRAHERFDHRFRACARLLQSLWRAEQGLATGTFTRASGQSFKLGSMLTARDGDAGRNFLTPEIAKLARREVAYREPRALIEQRRLWTNLLSSMPLAFNLLGPLRLDPKLATRMLRRLCPDLADATVRGILFEHSPGRADDTLTGDHTAFDAMLVYDRPDGKTGFVAIEVKYSESMGESQRELKPRYGELAPVAGLHKDPLSSILTEGPLQQFYRQHLLAQAMLIRGDYAEGRFVVIAPSLNSPVQSSISAYAGQLVSSRKLVAGFASWTLEEVIEHLRIAGERAYAAALRRRYCDWDAVDRVIEEVIAEMCRPPVANDNKAGEEVAA